MSTGKSSELESINKSLQLLSAAGDEREEEEEESEENKQEMKVVNDENNNTGTEANGLNNKQKGNTRNTTIKITSTKIGKRHKKILRKRHKKILRKDPSVSRASLRKLFLRSGCYRVQEKAYYQVKRILFDKVEDLVKDSILFTANGRRKTIKPEDVRNAIKRKGKILYGYESC